MTPSEAFAAWIDGKRVEVRGVGMRHNEWNKVVRFSVAAYGLTLEYDNDVSLVRCDAVNRDFRLKDAATVLAPVSPHNDTAEAYRAGQADSEAWGLLLACVVARESGTDHDMNCAWLQARDALKKAGKL